MKDCIARAGSLHDGLRYYVGAAMLDSDGGYAGKVLSEQAYLAAVADGKRVPITAAHNPPPMPAPQLLNVDSTLPAAESPATEGRHPSPRQTRWPCSPSNP